VQGLAGKVAIVTGASRGIGLGIAQRLVDEGAQVCLTARKPEALEEAVAQLGGADHAIAVAGKADDAEHRADAVRRTVETFGSLDLLVNNAGIEKQVPLLDMSLEDWSAVLQTNLTGAFLCLREAGRVMAAAGGGTVVNMSSVHEFIPWPGFAHYCASKGGLKLLMETAARELAPKKIRVLNVAPGAIVTPINQFVLDDPEAAHAVVEEIPLGRMGKPEEIAAAVAWAASDEAAYLTGTTIVVDGGMSLYPKFV